MQNDPFAQFERSRNGLLIPIVLFVMGAFATVVAIQTLQSVDSEVEAQVLQQQAIAAEVEQAE